MIQMAAILTIVSWAAVSADAHAAAETPNIVLVMCDDLGWGDVGFNGGKIIQTPHLDEMAAGSLKFTRFYAASAVCSPTRASCLTGRHPYRLGIPGANSGHLKPQEGTLAELLKRGGYTTGHFGKWHLGTLTTTAKDSNRGGPRGAAHFAPPWEHGFDVCFSTEAKVPTYDPMLKPEGGGSSRGWEYLQDAAKAEPYGTHYWNERGEVVTENLRGDDSRVIMDRVVPFIEQAAKAGKPFFAVVWFHAPHLPVVAGPTHAAMYSRYDSYHRNYYGCVTAMDQQVGRLRATLRTAGVADNTLLTFCSDNGPEGNRTAPGSAGPLRGRKRDLLEGGIRVPGLVEWPARIPEGRSTDVPAVTSDYLPTVLEIVGARLPDQRPVDGVSLLSLFDGKMTERPAPIGFEYAGKTALVGNRWKIIQLRNSRKARTDPGDSGASRSTEGSYMLIDLVDDPGEQNDLSARYPEVVQRMAGTLEAWRASCRQSSRGADYSSQQQKN